MLLRRCSHYRSCCTMVSRDGTLGRCIPRERTDLQMSPHRPPLSRSLASCLFLSQTTCRTTKSSERRSSTGTSSSRWPPSWPRAEGWAKAKAAAASRWSSTMLRGRQSRARLNGCGAPERTRAQLAVLVCIQVRVCKRTGSYQGSYTNNTLRSQMRRRVRRHLDGAVCGSPSFHTANRTIKDDDESSLSMIQISTPSYDTADE